MRLTSSLALLAINIKYVSQLLMISLGWAVFPNTYSSLSKLSMRPSKQYKNKIQCGELYIFGPCLLSPELSHNPIWRSRSQVDSFVIVSIWRMVNAANTVNELLRNELGSNSNRVLHGNAFTAPFRPPLSRSRGCHSRFCRVFTYYVYVVGTFLHKNEICNCNFYAVYVVSMVVW